MKKIIILLITMFIMFTINTTYAYVVNDPDIINELNEGEAYINGKIQSDFYDVRYIGNGYLVSRKNESGERERFFTEDFQNLKKVNVFDDKESFDSFSRAGFMDEIKWANGVYIARSNVYDNIGKSGRVLESDGYLYILNLDFQLIKKIKFDCYVREMSFIDGVYYVRITNESFLRSNKWTSTKDDIVENVYESSDLENWTERPDLERVPVTNGNNTVTLKNNNIYIFKNGEINNQIVFEEANIQKNEDPYSDTEAQQILNLAGEYFYIVDNSSYEYGSVWMSTDGVYMTKYILGTEGFKRGADCLVSDGYLFVKKSDIDRYLLTGDVYVQYNDKILGFSQPPVMENDRTLVPMRFLFEQMGADVTWDESTDTATATLPTSAETRMRTFSNETEKSVTFSIDNTNATVNGQPAEMDVPARLVNDKTLVPLRFLSENLGCNVEWDEDSNTAIITTK